MNNNDSVSGNLPDHFDRLIGSLHGLPGEIHTKPSTIRVLEPLLGNAQTYIIQTYRHRDPHSAELDGVSRKQKNEGDHIFIECVSREQSFRLALPPAVANAIARQRDSLTDTSRSKAAKAAASDRKARGVLPGFLKGKRKSA